MKDVVAASRYAKAFFQAAQSSKQEAKAQEDLQKFAGLLRTDTVLLEALKDPLLPLKQKLKLAAKKMGKFESDLFGRFLDLVLAKKRLSLFQVMVGLYNDLLNESKGVRKVSIKSAVALGGAQSKSLEKRLSKAWDCPVILETSVDESLIGGMVMKVDDQVWDRSLDGQLQKLKETLLESRN